jgi:hypothetical protein
MWERTPMARKRGLIQSLRIVPKHRSLIYTVRPRGRLQGPIGHSDNTTRYLPGRLLPTTRSNKNRRARMNAEFRQEVSLFTPITGLQLDTILCASTLHQGAIRWQYLRHSGPCSLGALASASSSANQLSTTGCLHITVTWFSGKQGKTWKFLNH